MRDQRAETEALPLAGVKVVDFSRLLPGPWCAQLLGDLGAEVIKVERPEGDPSRHNPPLYRKESVYFCSVNGNKRSAALDLTRPDDVETARRLIAEADVLVESFGAGRAKKLGIDWEAAEAVNPRLVYCSLTGFGQNGPLAHIPGHDLAVQAMSGILGVTRPAMPAFQAGDYAAAAMAVIGILAALRARDHSGRGRFLDVAMFDGLFGMGNIAFATALSRRAGGTGAPAMEVWGGNPRYAIYPTSDGRSVAVCLLETKIWREFCAAIGRTDLIFEDEDPSHRLSSHGERAVLYREAIAGFCAGHSRDEIGARMIALGLPVLPVLSPAEAVESEHAQARGLVETVEHPTEGSTAAIRSGLGASGLVRGRRLPAPVVGDWEGAGFGDPAEGRVAVRRA